MILMHFSKATKMRWDTKALTKKMEKVITFSVVQINTKKEKIVSITRSERNLAF